MNNHEIRNTIDTLSTTVLSSNLPDPMELAARMAVIMHASVAMGSSPYIAESGLNQSALRWTLSEDPQYPGLALAADFAVALATHESVDAAVALFRSTYAEIFRTTRSAWFADEHETDDLAVLAHVFAAPELAHVQEG